MNNIILIGMPAVGKSTAGVILAKIRGYKFIDSDLLIQESEGKLLRDIIADNGIEGFLDIEDRINSSIQVDNSVIATGGSAVYCKAAMEHLKTIGTVIYLRINFEQLSNRLSNISNRGVVLKSGQNLKDLFDERTPLYEKYADIIIDEEDGDDAEAVIAKIEEAIS